LRVRPVEHGANAVQRDPNPRPSALADFGAKVHEKALDVRPQNVGLLPEDGFQRFLVPIHKNMVSRNDTMIESQSASEARRSEDDWNRTFAARLEAHSVRRMRTAG
jgi:hypothetical protein